jgi:acyl transferase domain-containing protein
MTTALQIALVDFLKALQVTPAAIAGHSSGEIAAAYVCQKPIALSIKSSHI